MFFLSNEYERTYSCDFYIKAHNRLNFPQLFLALQSKFCKHFF